MNTAYAIFAATDEEFSLIFPGEGQDVEFIEDVVARLGDLQTGQLLAPVWGRPIPKPQVIGIHGTLFYGLENKKKYYQNKREPVIDLKLVD
jgi:hypothetical protein